MIAELRRRYKTAEGRRKLTLAYALAEAGEVGQEYLTASVSVAGSEECRNIVTALANSTDSALQALTRAMATVDDSEDWTAKSRLAVVALHLGKTEPAADMLQFDERPDPIQRTVFVATFPKWHGNLHELAQQLRETNDGALRSGICLSVGSIEDVSDEARQIWQEVFSHWYLNQPDRGTHSAAGWALRMWKLELPEIQPSIHPKAGKDWMITPTGLTMLRIPAGGFVRFHQGVDGIENKNKAQKVRLTHDFLLSDREITVGQFQQFIDDTEYGGPKPFDWEGVDEDISPGSEHPIQPVSWYDAVMFCNWLSRREGLELCYEPTGEKDEDEEHDAWRLIDSTGGYRLPSEAQWEYACRAGTTTSFAFGEDSARLCAYGVYLLNSNSSAMAIGSKLCNAWGLFDMHGNVWEWSYDSWDDYGEETVAENPLGADRGSFRVYRGGYWGVPARYCQSSYRHLRVSSNRYHALGFRVARTPLGSGCFLQTDPTAEQSCEYSGIAGKPLWPSGVSSKCRTLRAAFVVQVVAIATGVHKEKPHPRRVGRQQREDRRHDRQEEHSSSSCHLLHRCVRWILQRLAVVVAVLSVVR